MRTLLHVGSMVWVVVLTCLFVAEIPNVSEELTLFGLFTLSLALL
jgi:hypothetical protein